MLLLCDVPPPSKAPPPNLSTFKAPPPKPNAPPPKPTWQPEDEPQCHSEPSLFVSPKQSLPSRSEQKRIALDGKAYTRLEFGRYDGKRSSQKWEDASLAHNGQAALAFTVATQHANNTLSLEDMMKNMAAMAAAVAATGCSPAARAAPAALP